MPGMTLKLAKEGDLHRRIVGELTTRIKMAERRHSDKHEAWRKAEERVICYLPESSDDAKRRVSRDSGQPEYTTIMIPYTYALLMSAHTYWTSVFFGRTPVHQFIGRHGETEQQTLALEALIGYQVSQGRMMAPYYLWAYDVGKYGVGILGTYWCEETAYVSTLIEDERGQAYVTREIPGYKGNKVYNVSPWDFLPDPRVPVNRFQEGEFLAVYRTMSWNDLIVRSRQNYYTNIEHIRGLSARPLMTSREGALDRPENLDAWTGGWQSSSGDAKGRHPAWVGLYEVYITLIPSEWGLGEMRMPEKWVFTVTSDMATVIQAQPLGLFNNRYPFDVWECETEAYALWNRGIPELVEPIQNTMDWLINSHFYNIRSIGMGRYVADPSRVDLSALEEGSPGWIVALRPEAWGTVTDINQVFQQIRVTDTTSQNFADFERMFQIGERVTGINEQIMGALAGGRKTATEIRTATGFGVNRLKTSSEYMGHTGFTDHAQRLVQNTQQFYDWQMAVRIVGDLAQQAGQEFMMVTPQDIVGFYDYVPVDGTQPVDRFAQATLWKDILGQMGRVPQVMAQYDVGRIFAWVASLAGLKNLERFRIQVAPDQMLADQAGAGNLIPFPGGAAGGGSGSPGPQSNVASIPTTNVAQ